MQNQINKNREEESIINGINNLFRLGKDTVLENIRHLFRLGKDTVLEGIKSLFGQGKNKALKDKDIEDEVPELEEDYYKPARIGNTFNSNIEYRSNEDKDKILSFK